MSPKTRKLIHEGKFEEVQEMMRMPILALVNRLSIEHEVKIETVRALSAAFVFSVMTRDISPKTAAIFHMQAVAMFAMLSPQLNISPPKGAALIKDVLAGLEEIAEL